MPSVVKNFSPGKKNYLGQNDGKKVDFASFLPTKYKKNAGKCLAGSDKKATNFGFKLFTGTYPRNFLTNLKKSQYG